MIAKLLIGLVRLYQMTLSRLLPPNVCIYEPSCSHYMVDAIRIHGVLKGVAMGVWRICRCHPLARGGYDPVPPAQGITKPTQAETACTCEDDSATDQTDHEKATKL